MKQTQIAGMYRDFMERLPVVRAPGAPSVQMIRRPDLAQILTPSARQQRIAAELQRLPSPSALSLLM